MTRYLRRYQCRAGQESTNQKNRRLWLVKHGLASMLPVRYKPVSEVLGVLA